MLILDTLLGAAFMRIKGGGLYNFNIVGSRGASSILFSLLVFSHTGPTLEPIFAGAAWWLGCSMHVRNYLLALGGYKGSLNPRAGDGDPRIDAVIDFIMDRIPVTKLTIQIVNGWVATTLRGLTMAVPLAIVFQDPFDLLIAPAMALCYYMGISYQQWRQNSRTLREGGWSMGEWLWGGVIGVFTTIAI